MPLTAEPLTDEATGTFRIGDGPTVRRLGFGAMRLTGPGIWGEPEDPDECRRVLRRAVEVVGANGYVLNGVAAISYNGPLPFSGQYWEGAAYRTAGSASFGLQVLAFCMAS